MDDLKFCQFKECEHLVDEVCKIKKCIHNIKRIKYWERTGRWPWLRNYHLGE